MIFQSISNKSEPTLLLELTCSLTHPLVPSLPFLSLTPSSDLFPGLTFYLNICTPDLVLGFFGGGVPNKDSTVSLPLSAFLVFWFAKLL